MPQSMHQSVTQSVPQFMPQVRKPFASRLVAAALLSVVVTGAAIAQPSGGGGLSSAAGGQGASATDSRIDLDFRGGTLADFLTAIRGVAADANVIALGDVTSVRLPAFELRGVDVSLAMELLNRGIHVPEMIAAGTPPDQVPNVAVDVIYSPALRRGGPASMLPSTVITVLVTDPVNPFGKPQAPQPAPPTLRRTVESIAPLVSRGLAAEDVLDAIQSALAASELDRAGARIAFHEQTQLIMVTATDEGIQLINQTLGALRASAPDSQDSMQRRGNIEARLVMADEQNHQLRAALHGANAALQAAQEEVDRLRKQLEALMVGGQGGRGGTGQPGQPGRDGTGDGSRGGAGRNGTGDGSRGGAGRPGGG